MRKLYFALYYHWPLSKLTHFDIFTSLLRRTVAEKKFNQTVCFLMFWSKFAPDTREFC